MRTTHIGEEHVLLTEDESVWVGFYGEVPRVGEVVHFTRKRDDGSDENLKGQVARVEWFALEWLRQPGGANHDQVRLSSARVFVELS